MRKPMKRLFALALSVLLLVSQLGLTDGVAAQTEDPEATVQASVEAPASEPVQDPAPEPAEEPEPEPVQPPVTETVTEPEAEATEEPEAEATEVPEVEATEVPEVEATEVPEVEATEVPEVEATEVPEVEATEVPEVEAAEVPEVEATEVPEVEAAEVPEVEAAEEPEPTEEPEPVVSLMSASALEPIELDEDVPVPAAGGSITLTADPPTATAGTPITEITLTADGGTFADEQSENNFSISGAGVTNMNPTEVTPQDGGVLLTLSGCTPTQQGNLTVTVQKEAFVEDAQPDGDVTALISVSAADDPTVTASGSLQAGVSGKITLTIDDGSNNSFKSTETNDYTLSNGLTVDSVTLGGDGNKTATLTVTPKAAGSITVTVKQAAFTYQTKGTEITAEGLVTVSAAEAPKVTASGALIAGTAGGTIDLEITSGDNTFASQEADNYTLECDNGNDLTVESVTLGAGSGGNNTKATLKVKEAPTKKGSVTVKIDPTAFTYQPESAEITATGTVTINAATVKVNVEESTLIAGVSEGSIKIKLTTVNNFADGVSADMFSFDPESGAATGLNITDVSGKGTDTAELTVTGTPKTPGEEIIVTIKPEAFEFQPGEDVTATVTVSAPTGTLSAKLEGGDLYAGTAVNGQKITLTIQEGSQGLSFNESTSNSDFSLTGTGSAGLTIDTVSASGSTATLTLTGKPTTKGEVKVTAKTTAFDFTPDSDITATGDIQVLEVSGTVTASLTGALTAGTDATGYTITLTIDSGTLAFKDSTDLKATDFQLGEGSTGLSISDGSFPVLDDGKTVILTLIGTPNAGGSFDVTVKPSAFAVKPTDGKAVKATPSINVGYPKIELSADPNKVIENEAMSTVTLKATGGVFKAISSGTTNFSISGHSELSLTAVQATEGADTATLTISGTPTSTGTLTITVQPAAFKYQPQNEVTATVEVAKPSGSITANLSADLYAGTPVDGQTITLTIDEVNRHGLAFKTEGLTAANFTLGGDGATGLNIESVDVDGTKATLHLGNAPTTAGDITVTAKASAFKFPPASDIKASGTITVKAAPTVTLTGPESIVAGITKEITITLSSDNENLKFVSEPKSTWFILTGTNSGLSVEQVKVGSDFKSVTLTLSAEPSKDGVLIVEVDPQAFNIHPVSDLSATITVSALYGEISATLKGTLTAGTEVTTQTITLTIGKNNGLTFAANVGAGAFTLGEGSADLEIESVDRTDATHVTLTLSGTPKAAGTFKVTAKRDSAFAVPPTATGDVTATGDITIGYPTITLSVKPDTIYEGEEVDNIPITVTANGGVFNAETIEVEGNITISGHEELTLKSVEKGESDDTVVLHLSGTPSTTGTLTITVQQGAFTYQPEKALIVTVAVSKPTGTVTAKLTGEPLYAGTPVNGQTVILTIGASSHGLTFRPQEELEASEFKLQKPAADGLTIEKITRSEDGLSVTLTLGGTPTTAGDFEVDAEESAFTYDPGMEEPAGTFTVNPAPVIAVTADPASVTAGLELGAVTVTAEGGTFVAQPEPEMFTITSEDGIADNISVTAVKVEDDGTVTLTVTGAPTKDGTLLVTVDRTAFNIRPESGPQAKIAVTKLTGSVSMALAGGTLTAGTAADGLTMELAASGTGLTFREGAEPGDFPLTGPGAEGLTVASVVRTDETHVSLTLSGTPAAAGELGVTVLVSAFAVPPTDGEDVTAAPSVTVAYPTITLAPTPATVNEGETLETITLTATGGVFNAIDGGTDGFAISGVEGVTLVSVTAADGSDTATLTLSGVPSATGTLTVTVQPEAFKYQPEKAVSAAISVVDPTGTVNAALSNALYADTPVTDQTITITIADSHGLTFKDGLGPDSFLLTGAAATGLSISGVTGSGNAVTLTLSGTPAAGSFTVTVLSEAFTFDPGMDIDAGTVTVNAAPEVSLSAEPETLTAGEPVGTITLTAVGGAFAAQPDASLFALSGDAAGGLSVSAVSVEGAVAVLTVAGAPEIAGTLTVTVDRTAFAPVAAASPTVDITVEAYGDGSLSTEVEVDSGAPGTQFGSSDAELADAVLTEEEQALLVAGAKVVITLQEDDISDSVSSTDKAAVEANADGFTVGAYLDVSLLKSINDHETPIHETNRPIRVVFSIPTDLRGVSGREFAVVRVHEGSGTVLQDLDGDPNTVTVETDLFSTYAILYRDAPTEEPTDEPAEEPTDEPTDEPAEEPTDEPTDEPAQEPTDEPTEEPTEEPVEEPTEEPTDEPVEEPTEEPTPVSTEEPKPTEKPSATAAPTAPDTGDDEAPALWLALLALGAGALVLAARLLRRRSAQR